MSNRSRTRRRPSSAPRPTRAPLDPSQIEPVRITTTTDPAVETKRVPLFYIDDTEYTVPEEIPPTIGLRFLRESAEEGQDVAVYNLMVEVIGQEAYDSLADCDSVTAEQMDRVINLIVELAMGSVDKGKD